MGLIDELSGRRVYLDANALICALEGHPAYGPVLQPLLRALGQGIINAVTGELTLAETLVRPLQHGFAQQAQMYRQHLRSRPHFGVLSITRTVLIESAHLRPSTSLKLPDAIHRATAMRAAATSSSRTTPASRRPPESRSANSPTPCRSRRAASA